MGEPPACSPVTRANALAPGRGVQLSGSDRRGPHLPDGARSATDAFARRAGRDHDPSPVLQGVRLGCPALRLRKWHGASSARSRACLQGRSSLGSPDYLLRSHQPLPRSSQARQCTQGQCTQVGGRTKREILRTLGLIAPLTARLRPHRAFDWARSSPSTPLRPAPHDFALRNAQQRTKCEIEQPKGP